MTWRISWRRAFDWSVASIPILVIGITMIDYWNTAGDTKNPDLQLTRMGAQERAYCLDVLWRIDSSSNERDVLAILGAPDRSLKYKKNWWVKLDGHRDRVGVMFDFGGTATDVILDGGPGRFYYYRSVQDHDKRLLLIDDHRRPKLVGVH